MSVLCDAFEAVRAIAESTRPYARVDIGALPGDEGLCMAIAAGGDAERALDRGGEYTMDIVLNAKSADQRKALEALCAIHHALTRTAALPSGDGWQMIDLSTNGAPSYLSREENGQWLYGSGLTARLYYD